MTSTANNYNSKITTAAGEFKTAALGQLFLLGESQVATLNTVQNTLEHILQASMAVENAVNLTAGDSADPVSLTAVNIDAFTTDPVADPADDGN